MVSKSTTSEEQRREKRIMKRSNDSEDLFDTEELTCRDALAYLKGVKDAFGSKDKNKNSEFTHLLRDFSKSTIDRAVFVSRVKELFNGYPDLILGLNIFLSHDIQIIPDNNVKNHDQDTVDAINFVNKIKEHNPKVYIDFLEILNVVRSNPTDKSLISEACRRIAILFRPHLNYLFREFTSFLPNPSLVVNTHCYAIRNKPPPKKRFFDNDDPSTSRHKCKMENCSDSDCMERRYNPSYMHLTKISRTFTDKIAAEVLNNSCQLSVSYTPDGRCGNEDDYGEEHLYELDMLVDFVQSATNRAEEFLDKLDKGIIALTDSSFRTEDHFTAQNLRCIEQLYTKEGKDVIAGLRNNAALVLPVVLPRLKTKLKGVLRYRSNFTDMFNNRLQSGCH